MRRSRGFTLIEVLLAATLLLVAAMAAVAHVTRTVQYTDWSRDKVFARQKAVSILAELRAYVEGGDGEVAADLDGFDDGLGIQQALTIAPDPQDPTAYVVPNHPLSGNTQDNGVWRWNRRITVRRFPGVNTRDLRICTVRLFRQRVKEAPPGEQMAEVSSVIRTVGDAYPTTQVYDVYLLALENVPGWWVYMDAMQPFIEATFTDLESRNPGLSFRTHWITKLGYGRDEEYAPYTNEERDSLQATPWTYVYPGRMPDGEAARRYYVGNRMEGRVNLDGELAPIETNGYATPEPWDDVNGNGTRDGGEIYDDLNGNGIWDRGNPVPYALADMHNHCMRWPEAAARFQARVDAGLDGEDAPTWRLLLDRMIADPGRFHNAILINLHGELVPMPPARNYSDAARIPETRPGWRTVTHPEQLRPLRRPSVVSDAPRFRVYAYKAEFHDDEVITTEEEPLQDANGNGTWDAGEAYEDWNGNGAWDAGIPISIAIRAADFSKAPNAATSPSLLLQCLSGGVDADGNGSPDDYEDWHDPARYPESFTDSNLDGIRQVAEDWFDVDGNGVKDDYDPHRELDGDGVLTTATESLTDANGNGRYDPARPAEPYDDVNGNGRWDAGELYYDYDKDGQWTAPTTPKTPKAPWDPAMFAVPGQINQYVKDYGEPFIDEDGDDAYDAPEPFFDSNGNGVADGGFERGEMWYEIAYDAVAKRTVLRLYGTPLETPYLDNGSNAQKGLPEACRLYDLDYVPCPTPASSAGTDRFEVDLFTSNSNLPKNTARWVIELPVKAIRKAYETTDGAEDGETKDKLITLDTRFGRDLETGTLWPTRNQPTNLSTTYAYFYGDLAQVPFSERYQFQGDPRHCPYADLDRAGASWPNGYNWYFDNLADGSYNAQSQWDAFDTARMRDGWMGRSGHDVPRLLGWLRTALVNTEAVYTTLTGFSYYYLSLGGDIGYDASNGFPDSIPMDGTPFGLVGQVYENTIIGLGTASINGSRKFVRSNDGTTNGVRTGGLWWSKPWLGELYPDDAYAKQWAPWGNLRAATGSLAETYRLIRRDGVPSSQIPRGTDLFNYGARLKEEGSTSVFNIGTSASTFHHQYKDGQTGTLTQDGPQLAENYNFPMPTTTRISRPFGLSTSGNGGVGPEFSYTTEYPRFSATMIRKFYNHQSGQTGSGLVGLVAPAGDRSAYIVVNGIDRTIESGSAFIARYATLSLIHSYFAGGVPTLTHRIAQLPRVNIRNPTLVTELEDPASIPVQWRSEWVRWDGAPYTDSYPADFKGDEADLIYVLMYSKDGGRTWLSMLDDQPLEPGVMPWIEGVGPDPARVLADLNTGGDETWVWNTPSGSFPEGSYLVRIEAYRSSESLHYSQHMEKIYVNR